MTEASVTLRAPASYTTGLGREEVRKDPIEELRKEYFWLQSNNATKCFNQVLYTMKECCTRLYVGTKCEPYLKIEQPQPSTEQLQLTCKNGSDSLKAKVSLLADNVIQAEVHIKHAKSAGGVYRGVAQPDVQWKLQQLQDAGNQCARGTVHLAVAAQKLQTLTQLNMWNSDSGDLLMEAAKAAKQCILTARNSLLLPRKRSLLELCHFPPTKKFAPPLPQDLLLSFYISGSRLVCASYQMTPKPNAPQSLTVSVSECQLPYLADVIGLLSQSISQIETLIHSLETLKIKSQKH